VGKNFRAKQAIRSRLILVEIYWTSDDEKAVSTADTDDEDASVLTPRRIDGPKAYLVAHTRVLGGAWSIEVTKDACLRSLSTAGKNPPNRLQEHLIRRF
jgi:hypothetical protein